MNNFFIFITIINTLLTLTACDRFKPSVHISSGKSESEGPVLPPPPTRILPTKCSEVLEAPDCKDEIGGKTCEWKNNKCQDKEEEAERLAREKAAKSDKNLNKFNDLLEKNKQTELESSKKNKETSKFNDDYSNTKITLDFKKLIAEAKAERSAKEEYEKLSDKDKNSIKIIKQELLSLVNKANKLYQDKDRPNSLKQDKEKIENIKNLIDKDYSNLNELTYAKKELQNLITKFDNTLWGIQRNKALALHTQIEPNKSAQEIITAVKESNVLGDILNEEFDRADNKTVGTDEEKMVSKLNMVLKYGDYSKLSNPEEIQFKENISLKLSDEASKLYDKAQKESDKIYYLSQIADANKITDFRINENNRNILQKNLKEKMTAFFNEYINKGDSKESIKKIIELSSQVFISKGNLDNFQEMLMENVKKSIDEDNDEKNKEIIEALIFNRKSLDNPHKNRLNSRLSFIEKLPDESLKKLITKSIDYNFDNEKLDKWLLEIIHTKKDLSKLITLDNLKKLITKFDLYNKKVGYSEDTYYSIANIIETLSNYKNFEQYFNTEEGKKVLQNIENYNVTEL
jgi:hypothetical protein